MEDASNAFAFNDLPDSAVYNALTFLSAKDVSSCISACSRVKEIAEDDRIWQGLTKSRYGIDYRHFAEHSALNESKWRDKFRAAKSVDDRWTAAATESRAAGAPATLECHVSGVSQPMFCVNHIGGNAFLVSGGSGSVHLVTPERSSPDGPVKLVCKASQEANTTAGLAQSVSASIVTGVSSSPHSPAKDVTVLNGSFSGDVSLSRVNWWELSQLHALPAKRLKAILKDRGVSFEGLTEKAEFLAKVKAWDALPLLSRMVRLQGHLGTVVSCSHHGDLGITGGNEGVVRVWRLGVHAESSSISRTQAGLCLAELRTSSTSSGVDAVQYDARWGVAYSGDKAGVVSVWDLAGGGRLSCILDSVSQKGATRATRERRPWIWCIRSSSTWADSMGHEPSLPHWGNGEQEVDWGTRVARAHSRGGTATAAAAALGGQDGAAPIVEPTWLYEAVAASKEGEDDEAMSGKEREEVHAFFAAAATATSTAHVSTQDIEANTFHGDGRTLLTGDSDGWCRLWDLRACGSAKHSVQCVQALRLPPPAREMTDLTGWSGSPIAGMSAMFGHGRFVTSSFDGCARVWDLRSFRVLQTLSAHGTAQGLAIPPPGMHGRRGAGMPGSAGLQAAADRLCRVDVSPDMIVAGSMDGGVLAWDMWPESR